MSEALDTLLSSTEVDGDDEDDGLDFDDNLSLGSLQGLANELETVDAATDALKRRKLNNSLCGGGTCSPFEKMLSSSPSSRGGSDAVRPRPSPPATVEARAAAAASVFKTKKPDLRNCTCLPGFFESPTKDKTAFEKLLGPMTSRSMPTPTTPAGAGSGSARNTPEQGATGLKGWLDDVLGTPSPPAQPRAQQPPAPVQNDEDDDDKDDDDFDEDDSCCPKLKKRGRKPSMAGATADERAEIVKKRNRAHAQATRRRQRMYIEYLKSQVEELSVKQRESRPASPRPAPVARPPPLRIGVTMPDEERALPRGEEEEVCKPRQRAGSSKRNGRRPADECIDLEIRSKAVALKFLELRTSFVEDPAHWGDLLSEGCVVTMPSEPFRTLPGEVANNRHTLRGIAQVVADNESMVAFVRSLGRPHGPRVTMSYRVEPSKTMLLGEKLFCQWRLATSGLVDGGFGSEVSVDGVMQASFNARRRLEVVELIYDVNALLQGLSALKLAEAAEASVPRPASPAPSDLTQCVPVQVAQPVPCDDDRDVDDRAPTPVVKMHEPVAESRRVQVPMVPDVTAPSVPHETLPKFPMATQYAMAALSQQAYAGLGFVPQQLAPQAAVAVPQFVPQPRPPFMMVPVNMMPNMMPNMMMPMAPSVVPMPMLHGAMPPAHPRPPPF